MHGQIVTYTNLIKFRKCVKNCLTHLFCEGNTDLNIVALYRALVKSTALESLERAELTNEGFLGDRLLMVTTAEGRHLSQRELTFMAMIRAEWETGSLVLSEQGGSRCRVSLVDFLWDGKNTEVTVHGKTCQAIDCGDKAADWLTGFLRSDPSWGKIGTDSCRLVRCNYNYKRAVEDNAAVDDARLNFQDGQQLLVVSTGSLAELNTRLEQAGEAVRASWANFRPNVVIDGPAYVEDMLREVEVNGVRWRATTACQRCSIITVNPRNGEKAGHVAVSRMLAQYRRRRDLLTEDNKDRFECRREGDKTSGIMFGMQFAFVGEGKVNVGGTMRVISADPEE
jgi:uncharacterized protein